MAKKITTEHDQEDLKKDLDIVADAIDPPEESEKDTSTESEKNPVDALKDVYVALGIRCGASGPPRFR